MRTRLKELRRKPLAFFGFLFLFIYARKRFEIYDDGVLYGRFYPWNELNEIAPGYSIWAARAGRTPVDGLKLRMPHKDIFVPMACYDLLPLEAPLKQTEAWKTRDDNASYGEMLADYLNGLKQTALAARYRSSLPTSP